MVFGDHYAVVPDFDGASRLTTQDLNLLDGREIVRVEAQRDRPRGERRRGQRTIPPPLMTKNWSCHHGECDDDIWLILHTEQDRGNEYHHDPCGDTGNYSALHLTPAYCTECCDHNSVYRDDIDDAAGPQGPP
jgi:hypothetical protein